MERGTGSGLLMLWVEGIPSFSPRMPILRNKAFGGIMAGMMQTAIFGLAHAKLKGNDHK